MATHNPTTNTADRLSEIRELALTSLSDCPDPEMIDHAHLVAKRLRELKQPLKDFEALTDQPLIDDLELFAYALVMMMFCKDITPDSLCFAGLTAEQDDVVRTLYHRPDESELAYFHRLITAPIARVVKTQQLLQLHTDDTAMSIDHSAAMFMRQLDRVNRGGRFPCDQCGVECVMVRSMNNSMVMISTDQLLGDWDFLHDMFSPILQTAHATLCTGPAATRKT